MMFVSKIHSFISPSLLIFVSACLANISRDPNEVKFFLYPNPADVTQNVELQIGNSNSIHTSGFRPRNLTILIIHGLLSSSNSPYLQSLKNSYLGSRLNASVLMVDWSELSNPKEVVPKAEQKQAYSLLVDNVEPVGQKIAQFVYWLAESGYISSEQVHLVGVGMGAHVAGEGGNEFKRLNGGVPLYRITGLDPQGRYSSSPYIVARSVSPQDASFVDLIHTNGGQRGDYWVQGHADFYPNGGVHQPNCDDITSEGTCSSLYAVQIYAAALYKPFVSYKCHPMMDTAALEKCLEAQKEPTLLGPYCPPTARGTFFLRATNPP